MAAPPAPAAPAAAGLPLEDAVARALALLDDLTDEGRAASHHGEALRAIDLDECAAIAFLDSTRAGLGIVAGLGKGFVIAKIPGKRGWWSAPLAVRALHLSLGASAGFRSTSALLTLDGDALRRLVTHRARGPAVRLSAGAALAVSCPCAGGAASRDDSFEFGLAAADYRVPAPRGCMADYSVGVTFLARAPAAASAALLRDGDGGAGAPAPPAPPPPAATVLSGAVPTPHALRPLCRALNAAAHLPDRPAAPWPGASPASPAK